MSAERFRFPGSPTYVYADVGNRLEANVAHNYQGSPFTYGGVTDDDDFWSGKCLTRSDPATATQWPRPTDDQPVDAETNYTASWKFKALTWSSIDSIRLSIQWLDSGGSSLGVDNGPVISSPTEITRLELTAESPVGAAEARIYATIIANTAVEWRLGEMMFAEGTDPTFEPSARLTGDLMIEWELAADDWTSGGTQYIMNTLTGAYGIRAYISSVGNLTFNYGDGSSSRAEALPAPGWIDGESHKMQMRLDESAGAIEYWVDGELFGTDTFTAGPGEPSLEVMKFGQGFTGYIYHVRLYDGLDGLLVRELASQNASGAPAS